MNLSEEHKKEVERRIMETIISSLEKSELTESQYQEISAFILEKIDSVKTHHDLMVFLRDLTAKWSVFSFVLTLENGEVKNIKENTAAEKAEELVKNGNIEEAIQAAKDAILNSSDI